MIKYCRHCNNALNKEFLDLSNQPPSNAYICRENIDKSEIYHPLKVYVCESCWLVQIPEYANAKDLFTDEYAYFSSVSSSWNMHAKRFVIDAIKNLNLDKTTNVLEIASNDGYLLQNFKGTDIPFLGIEPTKSCAKVSKAKGIETREVFFTSSYAEALKEEKKFKLIIANNVLAHVPDINDFLKGISIILEKRGYVSIEFPHLLELIKNNQFDTIYHEHFSYLSLKVVRKISSQYNLEVVDVEKLSTHGGSLRVWMRFKGLCAISKNVASVLNEEKAFNLENINVYQNFKEKVNKVKYEFLNYLLKKKEFNERVIGYGAAAKGNTLLNFAGVKADLIEFVIDKAPIKQGKYLPGSHIPIVSPEILNNGDFKELIVFPWNIISEIKKQLNEYKLITFIPKYRTW